MSPALFFGFLPGLDVDVDCIVVAEFIARADDGRGLRVLSGEVKVDAGF